MPCMCCAVDVCAKPFSELSGWAWMVKWAQSYGFLELESFYTYTNWLLDLWQWLVRTTTATYVRFGNGSYKDSWWASYANLDVELWTVVFMGREVFLFMGLHGSSFVGETFWKQYYDTVTKKRKILGSVSFNWASKTRPSRMKAHICTPCHCRLRRPSSRGCCGCAGVPSSPHSHSLRRLACFAACLRTGAPSRPLPALSRFHRRWWRLPTSLGPTKSTPGRSSTPRPSPTPWWISARCSRVGNTHTHTPLFPPFPVRLPWSMLASLL